MMTPGLFHTLTVADTQPQGLYLSDDSGERGNRHHDVAGAAHCVRLFESLTGAFDTLREPKLTS